MNDAANCMHRQFTESQSYCPDCGLSRSEVLVAACEPFLKDEETPAECIARNRRDANGCLTMLIEERRKVESLQARLAEAEFDLKSASEAMRRYAHDALRLKEADALLRECRHFVKALCDHDDATCGCYQHIVLRGINAFLAPDSASEYETGEVCEACGGTGKAYLLHSRAERPCPMCQADQPGEAGK